MASRGGESVLRAAGLPELVAADREAFVELAVQLAADFTRLSAYRERLLRRDSPLFDTAARVLESSRRYSRKCSGLGPQPEEVMVRRCDGFDLRRAGKLLSQSAERQIQLE